MTWPAVRHDPARHPGPAGGRQHWPGPAAQQGPAPSPVGQPLVLLSLTLAGDPATPVAAMAGTSRIAPRLLVVPQPRDRELRLRFLVGLARVVLDYITARQAATELVPATSRREERRRYADAPQVLVPNRAARDYLGLLGRATRFQPTDGPYAADPLRSRPRPVADLPRRPRRSSRLRAPSGPDHPARRAMGNRAEPAGRRPPRRPARLDRSARRHDRPAGRARNGGPATLPARRPGHRPRIRPGHPGAPGPQP
jgi:hypothetical protein